MNESNFDPNILLDKLKKLENAANKPLLAIDHAQDHHVQIRPDKNISLAKFLPDPLIPMGYKAHPTTIAAMRKDIFVAGEFFFKDLEEIYLCKCKREIDLQFWKFCPYCESIPS